VDGGRGREACGGELGLPGLGHGLAQAQVGQRIENEPDEPEIGVHGALAGEEGGQQGDCQQAAGEQRIDDEDRRNGHPGVGKGQEELRAVVGDDVQEQVQADEPQGKKAQRAEGDILFARSDRGRAEEGQDRAAEQGVGQAPVQPDVGLGAQQRGQVVDVGQPGHRGAEEEQPAAGREAPPGSSHGLGGNEAGSDVGDGIHGFQRCSRNSSRVRPMSFTSLASSNGDRSRPACTGTRAVRPSGWRKYVVRAALADLAEAEAQKDGDDLTGFEDSAPGSRIAQSQGPGADELAGRGRLAVGKEQRQDLAQVGQELLLGRALGRGPGQAGGCSPRGNAFPGSVR